MPVTTNPLHTVTTQRKDNLELVGIVIVVTCDGVTNTPVAVVRRHRQVARDNTGAVIDNGEEISTGFKMADFPAAVQTALTNFVNAVDTKGFP